MEDDSIKLLRECDAGIKMGLDAINDVLTDVHSVKLRDILRDSTYEHEKLLEATKALLASFGDEEKKPKTMAKAMSHIKTSIVLQMKE